MGKGHSRHGMELWIGLISVALVIARCDGAAAAKFSDVSLSKGMISREQMDLRNTLRNKYWGAVIADFDRDEKLDLFLPNHGNNPDMYWGEGGRFTYRNLRMLGKDWHGAATLDVNGDGKLDILLTRGGSRGQNPSTPYLIEVGINSDDRATFSSTGEPYGLGTIDIRGRSASVLDVDCDGDLDILLVNKKKKNSSDNFIHVIYENKGNGKFVPRTRFGGLQNVVASWFHVLDVDQDGSLDILMMGFDSVELWMGTCKMRFKKDDKGRIPKANQLKWVRAAAEIDYDGDGNLDLYLARGGASKEANDILLENRNGFYVNVSEKAGIPRGGRHYHVLTMDANNDGFTDLYLSRVTNFDGPRVNDLLVLNEGGTFKKSDRNGTESKRRKEDGDSAGALDFDGDGRIDIVSGSRNSAWRLYRNITPQGPNRNWLTVVVGRPRAKWFDSALDKPAMGATVRVVCSVRGKVHQFVQRVGSQGQSHSQSYLETLHFGVGKCKRISKIIVDYVGGFTVRRITPVGVNRKVKVGLYHGCQKGFDGKNCDEVIPACSRRRCSPSQDCETLTVTGKECEEMSRCDPSRRRFGMRCYAQPCLKLFCPLA